MTDYCNRCSQPWEFHGTACITMEAHATHSDERITDLEQRVTQLERNAETRESYEIEMIERGN